MSQRSGMLLDYDSERKNDPSMRSPTTDEWIVILPTAGYVSVHVTPCLSNLQLVAPFSGIGNCSALSGFAETRNRK